VSPARLLIAARGLRAFGDGFVSLLLPVYLTALGLGPFDVGVVTTATLLGSAALTLWVGFSAQRIGRRRLLTGAALLMVATGLGFAAADGFWPLLVIAFVGTLNPSSGDVSLFLPLEHALLAENVPDKGRTAAFAHYSLAGALVGAVGSLAAGLAEPLGAALGTLPAFQLMFVVYAGLALVALALYRMLPRDEGRGRAKSAAPLRQSRRIVLTLTALFSLDAFGGGFVVQSLLALWLFQRFDLSLAAAATIFFWSGVLAAFSFPVATWLSARIGLVRTMVFTHLPANLCLMLVPVAPNLPIAIALLLVRAATSSMDVPARTSYVMAVVTPEERAAASSITLMPRSLAAAASPLFAGWLLGLSAFGWPLVIGGGLKAVYDLLLLRMFQKVRPPEEQAAAEAAE
jgi:MFS family permease